VIKYPLELVFMGKIGEYDYPDLSVEDAIEIARKLVIDFSKRAENRDAFAQAIGHANAKSGTFLVKIGDMRKYGLIQSRDIASTALAEKIVYPNTPAEKEDAIRQMFENISLTKLIREKLGAKVPDSSFHIVLQETLGVEREEANTKSDDVKKFYSRAMPYVSKIQTQIQTIESNAVIQKEPVEVGNKLCLQAGDVTFKSDLTPDKIRIAIQLLKSLLPPADGGE
jgi:hypothetical protein